MKTETEQTVVIFRKWKDNTSILALFPYEAENLGLCSSYEHVGQHASADYRGCIARTTPATPAEYKDLADELTRIGYNLKIQRRAQL